jgi:chemotaxis protein MotB
MGKRSRRGAEERKAEADTFMMMFVTLSLLLLAFFILLNSMSVIDSERKRAALGSLLGSFGILPGAGGTDSEDEARLGSPSAIGTSGMVQVFEAAKKGAGAITAAGGAGEGDVRVTFDKGTGTVRVVLSEGLLYPAGATVLSPEVFPMLDRLAESAGRHGAWVEVVGHTDDRHGAQGNWLLSLRRGATIGRYLEEAGDLGGRVRSSGAGEHRPVGSNDTPEGRSANRRVEILITEGKWV